MDFEQVRNIIAESLGCDVEQVTLEAALVDDLGADSLATGVSIDDDSLAQMKVVGDIMNYLKDHSN